MNEPDFWKNPLFRGPGLNACLEIQGGVWNPVPSCCLLLKKKSGGWGPVNGGGLGGRSLRRCGIGLLLGNLRSAGCSPDSLRSCPLPHSGAHTFWLSGSLSLLSSLFSRLEESERLIGGGRRWLSSASLEASSSESSRDEPSVVFSGSFFSSDSFSSWREVSSESFLGEVLCWFRGDDFGLEDSRESGGGRASGGIDSGVKKGVRGLKWGLNDSALGSESE